MKKVNKPQLHIVETKSDALELVNNLIKVGNFYVLNSADIGKGETPCYRIYTTDYSENLHIIVWE